MKNFEPISLSALLSMAAFTPPTVIEAFNNNHIVPSIAYFQNKSYKAASRVLLTKPVKVLPTYALYAKINQFGNLPENWDGEGALKISKEVIKNSQVVIKNFPESFLKEFTIENLTPTGYGTIVIDIAKNENLLSLEIGQTKIGFFTDLKNVENFSSNGIQIEEHLPVELFELFYKFDKIAFSKENTISN